MGSGQDHRRRPRAAAGARLQHLTSGPGSRRVSVEAVRFGGWVERFAARHGDAPPRVGLDAGTAVLAAADGATARCDLLVADPDGYADADALVAWVCRPHAYGLLLVRRGGWAVGLATAASVGASRVGTRYVQGRTKAGGWSQQRYARRRAGQADVLVAAAAAAARDVLGDIQPLVTGGDRLLLRGTVAAWRDLGGSPIPSARRVDVPDPRRRVLDQAAVAATAVRVTVVDPPVAAAD